MNRAHSCLTALLMLLVVLSTSFAWCYPATARDLAAEKNELAEKVDGPIARKSDLAERPRRQLLVVVTMDNMNRELADDIEITDMLHELYDKDHVPPPERMRELRVKIHETILECYMDATSVEAEARREANNLQAILNITQAKVDRRVNYNNAINFLTTGTTGMVVNSMELSPTTPLAAANVPEVVASAISTLLSAYAMKQNAGPKIEGQNQPNMLSELFGRTVNAKTTYPESVWRFFHENSPRAPGYTRAQLLEKEWVEKGYIEKSGTRKSRQKLDYVCGMPSAKKYMTLSDLTDEINMLGDIEALAGLMHHHLRDLLSLVDTDIIESRTHQTSLPH